MSLLVSRITRPRSTRTTSDTWSSWRVHVPQLNTSNIRRVRIPKKTIYLPSRKETLRPVCNLTASLNSHTIHYCSSNSKIIIVTLATIPRNIVQATIWKIMTNYSYHWSIQMVILGCLFKMSWMSKMRRSRSTRSSSVAQLTKLIRCQTTSPNLFQILQTNNR